MGAREWGGGRLFIKVIEITFKGRFVQLVEARELERNVIKITVITFLGVNSDTARE